MKRRGTFPFPLPHSLKAEVERITRQDGIRINRFIAPAVVEMLSTVRTAEFFSERRERVGFAELDSLIRRQDGEQPGSDDKIA